MKRTRQAGIVVWPNAAFVLDRLGILDDIAAAAGRGALDIGLIDACMGYPSLSILRAAT